jgi:hypothetical protein
MAATSPVPRGRSLLRDPSLNRGTAFGAQERSALGLEGLLPAAVLTLEQQARRSYEQHSAQPSTEMPQPCRVTGFSSCVRSGGAAPGATQPSQARTATDGHAAPAARR